MIGWIGLALYAITRFFEGYFKGMADHEMRTGKINTSWENKYAKDKDGNKIPAPTTGFWGWYHRRFKLEWKEVKPFHATWFVYKTDKWHFANTWRNRMDMLQDGAGMAMCIQLTMFIPWYFQIPLIVAILLIFLAGFHLKYTRNR